MDPFFIPIIIFIAIWVAALIIAIHNVRKKKGSAVRRYGAALGHSYCWTHVRFRSIQRSNGARYETAVQAIQTAVPGN